MSVYPSAYAYLRSAVEGHLESNGDWNVNDWRDAAKGLLTALETVEVELQELRKSA